MFSGIKRLILAVVTAMGILIGSYYLGKRSEREDQRVDDLENYIKTREEIDNVETSPDRGAAIERLRDNRWVR